MGVPEQEIVVTGTVKSVEGDRVVVDTVAAQGDTKIIKNAARSSSCRSSATPAACRGARAAAAS